MGNGFRGQEPPLKDMRPVYNVIAPRKGEAFELTFLDSLILGTDCHWLVEPSYPRGRSRLCEAFSGDCPLCEKAPHVWLGWIGVIDHSSRSRSILRLGRESALLLSRRARQHTGLAGLRLKVTRPARQDRAALVYEESSLPVMSPLPHAHPLDHTICLVLGCVSLPDFRFGQDDIAEIPLPDA